MQKIDFTDILESYQNLQKAFDADLISSKELLSGAEKVSSLIKSIPLLGSIQFGDIEHSRLSVKDLMEALVDTSENKHYCDCLIMNNEGKLLIIQRTQQDDFCPGKWALPGGKVEKGEMLQQSAVRELLEETGLYGEETNYCCLYRNADGSFSHYFWIYTSNENVGLDANEIQNYHWVYPRDIENFDFMLDLKERIKSILNIPSRGKFLSQEELKQIAIKEPCYKGCLMAAVKINPDSLTEWEDKVISKIRDSDLTEDGIESWPHVTVKYGFDCDQVSPDLIKQFLPKVPLIAKITGVDLFRNEECDVLHYTIESEELVNLHDKLEALPHKEFYSKYNPHVTIAYLKKGVGEKYLKTFNDLELFFGTTLVLKDFRYSYEIEGEKLKQGWNVSTEMLEKSKRIYQIGEISQATGLKKVAPGKWVDPKTGKEVKQDDSEASEQSKKQEVDISTMSDEELAEHAKNASESDLQKIIKESREPKLREAAHKELERRAKEEAPKEEKEDEISDKEGKDKKSKIKEDIEFLKNSEKWGIRAGISNIENEEKRKFFDESDMENLTEEEKIFVLAYLSNSYRVVNKELREEVVSEDVQKFKENLETALKKLNSFEGEVYRTISFDSLGKISSRKNKESLLNFYKENKGKNIVENSFLSTGANKSKINKKFSGEQSINFTIISKTGKDLRNYNNEEKEVLFNYGTKFKVLSVVGQNVKLEEVVDEKLEKSQETYQNSEIIQDMNFSSFFSQDGEDLKKAAQIIADDFNSKLEAFEILQKAFDSDIIDSSEYDAAFENLEKAKKDITKLVKKKVLAKKQDGKVYLTTVYVKPDGTTVEDPKAKYLEATLEAPEVMVGQNVQFFKKGKKFQGTVSYLYVWDNPQTGEKETFIDIIDPSGKKHSSKTTLISGFKVFDQLGMDEQIAKGESDQHGYTVIKKLGGSTGAVLVEKDGVKYVRKSAANPEHLANEVRSLKYFNQMGVPVPEVHEYYKGDCVYVEYIGGKSLNDYLSMPMDPQKTKEIYKKISNYFLANALMANHDAIGLSYDNVMVTDAGLPYFVDVGGSMGFRAQGQPKESWEQWDPSQPIGEIKSMLDGNINYQSAEIFKTGLFWLAEKSAGQLDENDVEKIIKEQLETLEATNAECLTGSTEFSKKLAERFQALKDYISFLNTDSEAKTPDQYLKKKLENLTNKDRIQLEKLKKLYKKEIEEANKLNRPDIAQFYEDFCEYMFISDSEFEQIEKDPELSTKLKISSYDEYIERVNKDVDKYGINSNDVINQYHVRALKKHTDNSSYMNNIYRDLCEGLADGYNISFKSPEKVSFNKEKFFKLMGESSIYKEEFFSARFAMEAFSRMRRHDSPGDKAGGFYKKNVTLYRGLNLGTSKNTFLSDDNIICDSGISSNSDNYDSSFNRYAKIITVGAEGISVEGISGYGSEREIIMKPFNMNQIIRSVDTNPNASYDFDNRYQIRLEKPGLIPTNF